MTRAQFAAVVQADEKWVENAARLLARRLAYTPAEARWFGLVRLTAREIGVPLARAAQVAERALRAPPDTRAFPVLTTDDGVGTVVIDLARYHSSFAAALSVALNRIRPVRRGRPARNAPTRRRRRGADVLAAAAKYGVDLSLLRRSLQRTPSERLTLLDANSTFLQALQPAAAEQR